MFLSTGWKSTFYLLELFHIFQKLQFLILKMYGVGPSFIGVGHILLLQDSFVNLRSLMETMRVQMLLILKEPALIWNNGPIFHKLLENLGQMQKVCFTYLASAAWIKSKILSFQFYFAILNYESSSSLSSSSLRLLTSSSEWENVCGPIYMDR